MKTWHIMAVIGLIVAFGLIATRQDESKKPDRGPDPALIRASTTIIEKLTQDAIYTRGFGDGVNAAIRHIEFNTNTGRFTLEMTNVLADMKP